jgi:hypothetical protein
MSSERARVITLLDELQAAERAGAEALGHWLAVCREPAVRGGLKVIRARDLSHAVLAEARLQALGGVPAAQVSRGLAALCTVLAAPEVADRSKVAILLARFPAGVHDPFAEVIRRIEHDGETRALLETIGDDERASLGWLMEMRDAPHTAAPGEVGRGPEWLADFADALRAAETASAEVFLAWTAVCPLAGLRGGLRTIAAREATHAALMAESVRDLGASPRAAVPDRVRAAALARVGSRDITDEEKIARVLERHAEDADAVRPIRAAAAALEDHPEIREMLRLIEAGETATRAWLRAYHAVMAHAPQARAAGDEG